MVQAQTIPALPTATRRAKPRGFTMIEVLIVVMIMAITATIGMGYVSRFDASARPERAARECLLAFRYARQLAVTSGKSAKVTFNTSTNAFSVYWMSNGSTWDTNPVAQPAASGGLYAITMSNSPELSGTTLALTPSGTTTFIYNVLGTLDNSTVITFSFAGKTKTLVVSKVGDPVVQ